MSEAKTVHDLVGLQADNLLAFLALLGLLRTLEEVRDEKEARGEAWHPCASWAGPPWRPRLHLAVAASEQKVAETVVEGMGRLRPGYAFDGRKNIDFSEGEFRALAGTAISQAAQTGTHAAAVVAALASDGSLKPGKERKVQATALCAIFGQGHQNFLDRLERLAREQADRDQISRALFQPWRYADEELTFRWDPAEDRRYALGFADPSGEKTLTEAGAQRLAIYGFPEFSCVPGDRRIKTIGFDRADGNRALIFSWPIWHVPASLDTIRALLRRPELNDDNPGRSCLAPLGVAELMRARRISVGKYVSFERARPLWGASSVAV
jgi:hypothetical protein